MPSPSRPLPSHRPGSRTRRLTTHLLAAALLCAGLTTAALTGAGPAAAGPALPPVRAGLGAAIEAPQPYVGQSTCDPVAKPGVSAFRDLLLRTYPDSGSYGIVVDCGSGGQSEHKEGRAFDWKVSVNNPNQVAEVDALLAWLTATDGYGNKFAMARRFGIMYMIWNHQMWRSYEDGSWRAYSGVSGHTDHVHFSFGWNGANKTTSAWTGSVAPVSYGPNAVPSVPPFRAVANIGIVRTNGQRVLRQGSAGEPVRVLQRGLGLTSDGAFGNDTAGAVRAFQQQQDLPATSAWGPAEWRALFLPPVSPFGQWSYVRPTPGAILVSGWVIDADTTAPLSVGIKVANTVFTPRLANTLRADVAAAYPASGKAHGFSFALRIPDGTHPICLTGLNAPRTPGVNTPLGCRTVTVESGAFGQAAPPVQVRDQVSITGWALDTATADPVEIRVTVDGGSPTTLAADVSRPDVGAFWRGFGDNHGYAVDLSLPTGPHTVCVTAVRTGSTAGTTALGCQSVNVRHNSFGGFQTLQQTPTGLYAHGWALDPDSTAPTTVVLVVDGSRQPEVSAALPRADVAAAYRYNGGNHGWATSWDLAPGPHQVCAIATNLPGTAGTEGSMGCRTITISRTPVGALESVRTVPGGSVPGGSVVVTGWTLALDRATPGSVELRVDGVRTVTLLANRSRPEVRPGYPGYGSYADYGSTPGFRGTVGLTPGAHQVCAIGVTAVGSAQPRTALGCRTIVVSNTIGVYTGLTGGVRSLTAFGWALDPDTTGPVPVWAYVDGRPVRSGTANLPWAGLGAARPGYGDRHGWRLSMPTTPGAHTVCVTAINAAGTPGLRSNLGCTVVRVR